MKIKLNGKEKEIPDNINLAGLVESLALNDCPIVAEVCGVIVQPDDYAQTIFHSGDVVELIRFVGGG